MSKANPSSAHRARGESIAPHPQPGPATCDQSLIPPEGPPNVELRTGMKLPPEHRLFLDDVPQHASPGDGPAPPVGPPNITLRTGMKLPEAYWQLLEEDSPPRSSGDGPAPPVGPPNIELRNGVTMHPMHHLFEEILRDDPFGAGSTPPGGRPNIRPGTGRNRLRKLADLLSAVLRTRPVER